jgi:hypothetical protein
MVAVDDHEATRATVAGWLGVEPDAFDEEVGDTRPRGVESQPVPA